MSCRVNAGVDPQVGSSYRIKEAKKALIEQEKTENLIVEVRTESGAIWGRTILKPRRFKTGSIGYHASDRYRDPADYLSKMQFNCNLVKCGSKDAN